MQTLNSTVSARRLAVLSVCVLMSAFVARSGLAESASPELRPPGKESAADVTLEQIAGSARGLFYGVRWPKGGAACEATHALPGEAREWKSVSPAVCENVRREIAARLKDLAREPVPPKTAMPDGALKYGSFTGVLALPGARLLANLHTAASCDSSGQHCDQPELSPATALGVRLRDEVTRELGRLPPFETHE